MITSILNRATRTTFYGLLTLAIGLAVFSLGADAASGQNRGRTYSKSDIERLIRDVESSSRDFQRDFDNWLDRSPLDGQQREDRYNRQVQNLTSALSSLRSNFNNRNDWWLARSDMQRVLNAATPINSALGNREVRGSLNRQWGGLRRNLDRLASAFNLPGVGSNFTGSYRDYNELGSNVRACSTTGTYRGFTNNGESELTILGDGTATIRSLVTNEVYGGRCANDVLYFDWGAFNLQRNGRNVSTVEIGNTLNRTTYRRVSGYQGDVGQGYPGQGYPAPSYPGQAYPGQGYPEQIGNVPNWAIGTFRGMTNDGESEITISPNGMATARSLSTNAIFNGRYANDVLTFDWGSFRVVRDGRGISTIEENNQRNRTSYRRVN